MLRVSASHGLTPCSNVAQRGRAKIETSSPSRTSAKKKDFIWRDGHYTRYVVGHIAALDIKRPDAVVNSSGA